MEIILVQAPQAKGWELSEGDWSTVKFSVPTDALVDGCIEIDMKARFAMDKTVGQDSRFCQKMHFLGRLPDGAAVYVRVKLRPRTGGSPPGEFWIAYVFGDENLPPKTDYRYPDEVVLYVTGTLVSLGWRRFTRVLAKDVERAYGDRGLVYSELWKIRIRNSLSISPLRLY